jgi:hypothetical protein
MLMTFLDKEKPVTKNCHSELPLGGGIYIIGVHMKKLFFIKISQMPVEKGIQIRAN